MVTHTRARVFCSLKGTGFIELRISTDSTDQPTFARPPFPSTHPFKSSRSRFGSYAPTIFAVPRLGKIAVLQRLIPSRSAASVSTSSEHQRSRIALSRLKQADFVCVDAPVVDACGTPLVTGLMIQDLLDHV